MLLTDRPAGSAAGASAVPSPHLPRASTSRCGRPVFFRNSQCLACGTALGYSPERGQLVPLQLAAEDGLWCEADPGTGSSTPRYRRCERLLGPSACNWLIDADVDSGINQCRCCRLDRMLPDLSAPDNALWFARIGLAKRRLVSQLIALGLPLKNKTALDVEEADDSVTTLRDRVAGGAASMSATTLAPTPGKTGRRPGPTYLHLRDTLDTARSFGLDGSRVELNYERFDASQLGGDDDATRRAFALLLDGWMELTGVFNELSRSMGTPDFYPFVLSIGAVRKLLFVHRVVSAGPT